MSILLSCWSNLSIRSKSIKAFSIFNFDLTQKKTRDRGLKRKQNGCEYSFFVRTREPFFNCVARIKKKSLICIIFRGLNTTYICLGSSVCLCIHENYFWKMSRCKKCESWFFWESVPLWSTVFEEVYVIDTEKWNYVQTMYTYFVQIPKELSIKFWWCSYW